MLAAILTCLRHFSLDGIRQDARYALRAMRKKPAFTALAIVTLALGIGVNTASVAVAYGILVRPLPYHDPSRVVVLNLLFPDGGDLGFSPAALQAWLPRLRTVESAAGYYRREVTLRSGDRSTVEPAAFVTDKFFEVLGTPAESGRAASSPETSEILVGRRRIDRLVSGDAKGSVGMPVTVSDRAPHDRRGHALRVCVSGRRGGVWVRSAALVPGTKPQNAGYSKIVARLARGVTLEQFRDDANRVRLELNPQSREGVSLTVLSESAAGGLRPVLGAALAGALLVLLVASANVATLFIGRDVSRARELAARMALGATPRQLVRSVLVETALVAVMASLAGMGIGAVALKVFVSQAAGGIPALHRVSMGVPISSRHRRADRHRDARLRRGAGVARGARRLQSVPARGWRVPPSRVARSRGARRRADCALVRAARRRGVARAHGVGAHEGRPWIRADRRNRGEGRALGRRAA